MRQYSSFSWLTVFISVFGFGCQSAQESDTHDANQGGGGAGVGASAGSTTSLPEGGGVAGGGGIAGGGSVAGGGNVAGGGSVAGGGNIAGSGNENTCVSGTVTRDSLRLGLDFPGAIDDYSVWPPVPSTVKGKVIVERVDSQTVVYADGPASRQTLRMVDETGQRLSISVEATQLSFADVKVGTQFWLDAYAVIERDNPFSYRRLMRFSLRTKENGPVLFASLQGTKEGGELLLGLPLSVHSRCSTTYVSQYGGRSAATGEACTQSTELFDVVLDTPDPIRMSPGTTKQVSINENPYDLTLWSASNVTYPEARCAPADWAPVLGLDLDVSAKNWR